ncbi:dihydrolipoamide acetyltransferase family protein [Enterococcus olivae]
MAHEVLMPKLSSTMSEGTITVWLKNEGDPVEIGEAIFEVMTDKIAIEVEAYEEGLLLKRYIGDGESAPVNAVIAYIGEAGEEVPEEMPGQETEKEATSTDTVEETPTEASTVEVATESASPVEAKNIRATPAARRIAREKGLALAMIQGTGPKGRIQALDVKNYQAPKAAASTATAEETVPTGKLVPWSSMRQVISERMVHSKTTIPHVTMTAEVDLTQVIELRQHLLPLVEAQVEKRLSYLEIIAKAAMVALKSYPIFNAHGLAEGIQYHDHVNLGIAVAVEEGLVVPVIPQADRMGLSDLTQAVKEQTAKARKGQLTPAEMSGGTFTISSLGKSTVKTFNPIINAPEVAILGVGGMYEQLALDPDSGEVCHQSRVNLSLSFDHRVVDGAPASAFLSQIVALLENPFGLLL